MKGRVGVVAVRRQVISLELSKVMEWCGVFLSACGIARNVEGVKNVE